MSIEKEYRSPNYYVRKRLQHNAPAMFGLVVIIISIVIATLGYLIMPDSTPFANDGALQLKKLPMGSEVLLLKKRKNRIIEDRNVIGRLLFGQESRYNIEPIENYKIEGDDVIVTMLHSSVTETLSLIDIVKPLYIGTSHILFEDDKVFEVKGDTYRYVDIDGNRLKITHDELIEEFEANNIRLRTYALGTDISGRDMLSRLLYGTRISLSIGFVSVLISLLFGVSLGATAGFFGGRVDSFIMWLMSVVWSIPGIMLVISISLVLQSKGVWVAFVAVGLTMWVEIARVVRGQIMGIKQKLYIEAARAFGIKNFRIIFHHILPNIIGPIIVIATANFASAILLEAGLSFLGLSVQPPTPSWGIMINHGYDVIGSPDSWHLVVFPGIAICIMVLAFNLLGNGLRDAYDPKTQLK